MAGGQAMDMAADSATYDLHTITRLQQLKTGALLTASVEMGAILGRVPPESRAPLLNYARDIGLAFQIVDDLLEIKSGAAVAKYKAALKKKTLEASLRSSLLCNVAVCQVKLEQWEEAITAASECLRGDGAEAKTRAKRERLAERHHTELERLCDGLSPDATPTPIRWGRARSLCYVE